MKRLGVIVIYDKTGSIDGYIECMISVMQEAVFNRFVVVVNGSIQELDLLRLRKYTQDLIIRENVGFDAGAYKDVLLKFIPREEWYEYDEITFMNDTFYGPFYSPKGMWDRMDQVEADFWGITRHPCGFYTVGEDMPSHIQGYFLTIRKKMLKSQEFLTFWKDMPELKDVADAIRTFEVRFTTYFEECGFVGKTLMDIGNAPLEVGYNENPYLTYNFRLIQDKKIPFLKKKSLYFQTTGYEETLDVLVYIEREELYDTTMIWDNIFRLSREGQFYSIFNYAKLEEFYHKYRRIFIYGAGKYGQKIRKYFAYRKWSYVCFLVSRDEDVETDCMKYDDTEIVASDGIIMALNERNLEEVLQHVREKVSAEQLFLPEKLF